MAQVKFAGLSVEVPEGWIDRSSLVLVMPPAAQTDPRHKGPPPSPANVVIAREALGGRSATQVLDEKLAELGKGLPGFRLLKRGEEASALPFAEYTAQMGPALVQMMAVRVVDGEALVLTATAHATVFARHRDDMLALLTRATPAS